MSFVSNRTRGMSFEGLGEIHGFGYISPQNFNSEIKFAKLIYDETQSLDTSSKEYREALKPHINSLKIDFNLRPQKRYQDLQEDIKDKISTGEKDILDAEDKIKSGAEELEDGREKFLKGKKELRDGEDKLNRESETGLTKLKDAKDKLASSKVEIDKNEKTLKDGKDKLDSSEVELRDGKEKLDGGKREIDSANKKLKDGEIEYFEGEKKYERGSGELDASRKTLDQAKVQLEEGRRKLDEGLKKIETSKVELESGEEKYRTGLEEYQAGEAQYKDGLEQLAKGLGTEANIDAIDRKLVENESYMKLVEKAVGEYKKIEKEIDSIGAAISQSESQLKNLEDEIVRLESEKNSLSNDDPRYAQIEAEIKSKQAEALALKAEIQVLKQNQHNILDLKKQFEDEISKLSKQYGGVDIVKDYDKILNELSVARAGVDKLKESRRELDKAAVQIEESKKKLELGRAQLEEGIKAAEEGEREYRENLEKFKTGEAKYEDGKRELTAARQKLDQARFEIEDGRQKLNSAKKQYDDSLEKYNDGKIKYEKGKSEYETGVERLKDGKKAYEDGLDKYGDAQREYNEKVGAGRAELESAKRKLYKSEADLIKGQNEFEEKKLGAEDKISKGKEDLEDAKRILGILKIPRYSITPRYSNVYLNAYLKDSNSVDKLSLVFPVFFFLIAMLVTFTTMTRMVEDNRINIGTYKALGYTASEISKKYFRYGGSAALIGGSIGALVGSYLLPRIIGNAYSTTTIFENNLVYYFYPWKILMSILVGLIFSAISALISVRKTLHEKTADLLRKKVPKGGNRILLERIPFIWNRMNFLSKVTARNIFRYKKRMIMTIIGIMGCTALLILGFGIEGSVNGIAYKQFDEIMQYDLSITYDDALDNESYKSYIDQRDADGFNRTEVNLEQFEFEYGEVIENLTVISASSDQALKDFVNLRERKSGEKIELPKNGVVLSEKTAKLMGAEPGDTITITSGEGIDFEVEVKSIMEMYMGHYAVMSSEYYSRVFKKKFTPNTDLYKISKDVNKIKDRYLNYKAVVSAVDMDAIQEIMDEYVHSIEKVQVIITVASALLAMIVLYNLTNINIVERLREISTIKVLGFYANETTAYVYRETGMLTLLGIFIGMFVGKLLHHAVIQIVVPNQSMLDPVLTKKAYLISIFITVVVNLVIMFIFHNKLKNINMVESLKSNE
ncbi:FtsX-like permease family protein, partial [Peptoniphilus asaccharolyticus]